MKNLNGLLNGLYSCDHVYSFSHFSRTFTAFTWKFDCMTKAPFGEASARCVQRYAFIWECFSVLLFILLFVYWVTAWVYFNTPFFLSARHMYLCATFSVYDRKHWNVWTTAMAASSNIDFAVSGFVSVLEITVALTLALGLYGFTFNSL